MEDSFERKQKLWDDLAGIEKQEKRFMAYAIKLCWGSVIDADAVYNGAISRYVDALVSDDTPEGLYRNPIRFFFGAMKSTWYNTRRGRNMVYKGKKTGQKIRLPLQFDSFDSDISILHDNLKILPTDNADNDDIALWDNDKITMVVHAAVERLVPRDEIDRSLFTHAINCMPAAEMRDELKLDIRDFNSRYRYFKGQLRSVFPVAAEQFLKRGRRS